MSPNRGERFDDRPHRWLTQSGRSARVEHISCRAYDSSPRLVMVERLAEPRTTADGGNPARFVDGVSDRDCAELRPCSDASLRMS